MVKRGDIAIKKRIFKKICKDIKSIKIQGASNIAKAALKAYYLFPTEESKKILISLRPTEPMLFHVLSLAEKLPKKEILAHFSSVQNEINSIVFNLIKNNSKIYTHCHSTSVTRALIYAKKKGKKFEVYNTETRPLFQGRLTAKELSRAGIKVTNFIDSAAKIALAKQGKNDKEFVDRVLIGADAILSDSVINKVGSGMIAEIAYDNKIPVHIVTDSWKYSKKPIKIEQRDFREVWNSKQKKINVRNPAFESVDRKYIKSIISELGNNTYEEFIRKVKN